MVLKTGSTPVRSRAPGVPDIIAGPVATGLPVASDRARGGPYHGTIVADGGERLVRSAGFASYEQAEHAAGVVQRGTSRARFERRSERPPAGDLPARSDAPSARDRSDAERWLDQSGSLSSQAVTR